MAQRTGILGGLRLLASALGMVFLWCRISVIWGLGCVCPGRSGIQDERLSGELTSIAELSKTGVQDFEIGT